MGIDEATRACELAHWIDPDALDTLAAASAEVGDFEVRGRLAEPGDQARSPALSLGAPEEGDQHGRRSAPASASKIAWPSTRAKSRSANNGDGPRPQDAVGEKARITRAISPGL